MPEKDDLFNDDNRVASNWVSWGLEGDFFAGTLIAVREMTSKLPGKEGQKVPVYEVKIDRGSFHALDEKKQVIKPAIVIESGQVWNVGGKAIIDRQMRNIKLGTKLGMKFTETQPARNKGFTPLKVVKVFVPRGKDNKALMDEEWLKEQQSAMDAGTF